VYRLAQYGRREAAVASAVLWLLTAAAVWAAMALSLWFIAAAAVAMALWVWVMAFFRDPTRRVPAGEGLFVSPADGTVTDITNVGPESVLGRSGVRIGIFMNVFNVHVNRAPCDGVVRSVAHHSGEFLDARDPNASDRNEAATIQLTHTAGGRDYPVVVRQIAGLIARRIVTDLATGQCVRRGERIGMIKFGSRLELLVGDELAGEIRVRLGDSVRAGQTVLVAVEKVSQDGGKS